MLEKILVGVMCVIAFGAAGFGWWMESGRFSDAQDENPENKTNEGEVSDTNKTHTDEEQRPDHRTQE